MARRRYQTGRVFVRGKKNPVWVGRYRDDAIQPDGKTRRIERSVILGKVSELKTRKSAQRAFEPFLARVNSVDYRPAKFGKLGEFSQTWEREVLQHHKPSSVRAAQSHLRTYIRPWLGEIRLEELTAQAQQNFVTRLSQRVSRKTVLNVLTTLGSILRTAKSWGYCCHTINWGDLTLPADEVRKPSRFFTADEARRILAIASEPYRTIFAISAMTGLRAGEVSALQRDDLDFERGLVHVRRSAWYGQVQSVKTKTSRASVAMPVALVEILRQYLASWKLNPEGFLFLNRNGRPYSSNKIVQYGLWPVLDKLRIPRAGMHAFRHCHASLLIDVGANPKVAQQQMRHSDARTTLEAYAHVIGNAQREAVERVGEMLRPDAKFCAQVRPN
ncbi:MAG TPA: tyrosine-type recombinase/integrase [Candidatus Acidoferrales bacterium]|nr:tyrosine-type recombinase/integrase [Candidatus Acidoferrales bacterium]